MSCEDADKGYCYKCCDKRDRCSVNMDVKRELVEEQRKRIFKAIEDYERGKHGKKKRV